MGYLLGLRRVGHQCSGVVRLDRTGVLAGRARPVGVHRRRRDAGGLRDFAPYGEPLFGRRVAAAIERGDELVLDLYAGHPGLGRYRMVGDRRAGGHHVIDGVGVLQVGGQGRGHDAALGMPHQCHRLVLADAGLSHGFLDHAEAVRVPASVGVGAHEFEVLLPSERRIVLPVRARYQD